MGRNIKHREELLAMLDETVAEAVEFFGSTDEQAYDGYQTAREVLSHLAFWHSAYVAIVWALATKREPPLFAGTFAELNARAAQELCAEPMQALAERLAHRQKQLAKALRRLPDWSIDFPVKTGGAFESVEERVLDIERHIRNHMCRMQRALKREIRGTRLERVMV